MRSRFKVSVSPVGGGGMSAGRAGTSISPAASGSVSTRQVRIVRVGLVTAGPPSLDLFAPCYAPRVEKFTAAGAVFIL